MPCGANICSYCLKRTLERRDDIPCKCGAQHRLDDDLAFRIRRRHLGRWAFQSESEKKWFTFPTRVEEALEGAFRNGERRYVIRHPRGEDAVVTFDDMTMTGQRTRRVIRVCALTGRVTGSEVEGKMVQLHDSVCVF